MAALVIVLVAAGMGLVRAGWAGRRGAAPAGWILAGAALVWLTVEQGAWGLSVGLVAGSLAALVLVLHAGAISPIRPARRQAGQTRAAAPRGSPAIGRRLAVFLAAVPLSFAATQWLAFAIQVALAGGGPLDANSVATMMMVQPVAWSVVMAWQMVLPGPRQMIVPPLAIALAGAALWLAA